MNNQPIVSIIFPVYNAAAFVVGAINSILQQSYRDFELIIINDGSTDATDSLVQPLLVDQRIRYISRENKGLIATLNQGIALAQGDYIARMDADDIALPERLATQLAYLQQHPKVAVVGSAYQVIDEAGQPISIRKPPLSHTGIAPLFWFGSPFAHPSVMINKRLLGEQLYYDTNFPHAEDFELWIRLAKQHRLANLPTVLLKYRESAGSISRRFYKTQRQSMVNAIAKHYCRNASDQDKLLHAIQCVTGDISVGFTARVAAFRFCLANASAPFSKPLAWLYFAYTLFSKSSARYNSASK